MSKSNRRIAREQKYTFITNPRRKIVGIRGQRPEISPDPRPTKHGREPRKYEPPERWQ